MREIKYQFWDKVFNVMYTWESVLRADKSIRDLFDNDEIVKRQFTGLTDRNGVEIYEGDIVSLWLEDRNENSYQRKAKIIFDNNSACYCFEDIEPQKELGFFDSVPTANGPIVYYIESEIEFEIIGNIYEHPHLLEGVK